MKIKKLKIKLNKDNEYSDYRYFIPKSNNIKMTDGRDVDEAVQSLKDKIANLKEQANYLINKAPLVKYAEGTSITITDCAEAPLRKFSIEGDSYQETREGYNYWNTKKFTEETKDGVTLSINEDGTFNLVGMATKQTAFIFQELITDTKIKNSTEYTLFVDKNYAFETYIALYNGTTWVRTPIQTSFESVLNKNGTFNLTGADTIRYGIQIPSGKTVNYSNIKMMLVEGTDTTKKYEQYGESPSIKFEAPIESVGDNINLFDISTYPFTQKQAYNASGQSVEWTGYYGIKDFFPIQQQKTYSFISDKLEEKTYVTVVFYDSEKNILSTRYGYIKSFDTPENCAYIRFTLSLETSPTWFKLTQRTSTGAYSPYGQGSVGIYNGNKNLFDKDNVKKINNYIDSNGYFQYNTDNKIAYIKCKKNKDYTVSSSYLRGIAFLNEAPKTGLTSTNFKIQNTTELTLNSGENSYLAIWYYNSSSALTEQEILDSIQIEFGTVKTEYIEHQSQTKALYTQQPFRAIGDVKDRFVKEDGVWYEEHKIERKIFDGTETITKSSNTAIDRYVYAVEKIKELTDTTGSTVTSNYFKKGYYKAGYLHQNTKQLVFDYAEYGTTTLEDFKSKLVELYNAGTPMYVDYQLITPELIPCTAEQVEVLESLQSYDKITYYSVDKTNNVQANIKLIYKQDINAILEGEGV